ncbi:MULTISPECIES: endolytic transglycosylase MltG [unclassified Rhodococcus (in: high G+C Gram-positive bacteria)]|uniref:endolytic transglycosylase MltG n=1 Tax=unclassified Rhodococcus (in: high G+C Gram-positive bacteria) TaxID=192944 RepID=UPI00163A5F57|nr:MULTISPECIES: endolytic transglycosylase MltG [unclassified Rhodococcus (in: high G+C Gram-positive bacteria)]MBC2644033.1 endolytic transglycosylase MltG [Rhodococcus sp. 3A]MBC2891228.1 endolytic transglycosylase MltG [Rhodococcus sp. 4CII]
MSNHRRPVGERTEFHYVPRQPRRHRYLEDDDDQVDYTPPPDDDVVTTGRHAVLYDDRDHDEHQVAEPGVDHAEPVYEQPAYERPVHPEPVYEDGYGPRSYGDVRGYRESADDAHAYAGEPYEAETYETETYADAGYEQTFEPEPEHDRAFADAETQIIAAIPDAPVPEEIPPTRSHARAQARRRRQARGRARRGKVFGVLAAASVLIVLLGMVFVGGRMFFGDEAPADYAGPGGPEVVVQVHPGDTAEQIASALADRDVVASGSAFFNAAVQSNAMNSVQPGFYSLSTQIPAKDAVQELVDPASRVGHMIISEGRQLHDTTDVQTGAKKKGIYTLISEASCLGDAGQEHCIGYDDLNAAGAGELSALGVPDWAKDSVAGVPDRDRQLEGLIAAGSWDFDPTAGPAAILQRLVTESSASYEKTGILTAGNQVGLTPYKMLIAASLVEREAMPADFSKVARVILNRLAVNQALQFDSTVNYALDTTELATTDADRAQVTPWNTYASPGLPATPISSPSIGALQAVEQPAPGDWIYFVTVDAKGTTLFTRSYEEHLANIDRALNNGILNSGR